MKKVFFLIALSVITCFSLAQTKVTVIPTLHGLHKSNTSYNYDSVKALVSRLNPDVIVVEMRSIDVGEDTIYQKSNYPYEMWMMRYWFPTKTIEGFDWLGDDIEGKLIPPRYWQDASRIKYLQKRLAIDSVTSEKLKSCELYADERIPILQSSSLKQLLQSNDGILVRSYYDCLFQKLQGSDYEELVNFYEERNKHLQTNAAEIINKYAGKRIVVLTGDDHYPYLMDFLRKQSVQIVMPF